MKLYLKKAITEEYESVTLTTAKKVIISLVIICEFDDTLCLLRPSVVLEAGLVVG